MPFPTAAGHRLEYRLTGAGTPGSPALVFLHEGLGSAAQWRDVPDEVARRSGAAALVYSRYGYGRSDPLARTLRPVDYLHDEAVTALPAVLDALGLARPWLIGHSDGASIALIHAATARPRPAGLILEAPHVLRGGRHAGGDPQRRA